MYTSRGNRFPFAGLVVGASIYLLTVPLIYLIRKFNWSLWVLWFWKVNIYLKLHCRSNWPFGRPVLAHPSVFSVPSHTSYNELTIKGTLPGNRHTHRLQSPTMALCHSSGGSVQYPSYPIVSRPWRHHTRRHRNPKMLLSASHNGTCEFHSCHTQCLPPYSEAELCRNFSSYIRHLQYIEEWSGFSCEAIHDSKWAWIESIDAWLNCAGSAIMTRRCSAQVPRYRVDSARSGLSSCAEAYSEKSCFLMPELSRLMTRENRVLDWGVQVVR